MKYIVGIDEAGRGPLAGPVSVGAVILPEGRARGFLKGIRDSKKLSEKKREEWFKKITDVSEVEPRLDLSFAVALISEKIIDKKGIVHAINLGIAKCLKKLKVPYDSQIFLDGGIKAPEQFKNQKTVIKGDEKIAVISLASICAKVTRDRYMCRFSKKYPEYNLHIHKGYGTVEHRRAIKKHGMSPIHRRTFIHI